LKAKHDDVDSLELEFLTRGNGREERRQTDAYASSSLTPMLLDLDDDAPTRDELANGFFGKSHDAQAPLPIDEAAREAARFETPAFKERQRYLARYVAGAVAASSVICLAAFFRVASAAPDTAPHAARASFEPTSFTTADVPQAAPLQPPVVAAEAPRAPEPAVAVAPTPAAPPATPTPTTTPPATDAPTSASVPAAASASDGPSARQSKEAAMHLLEHGNWNAAIAAAERSVRLDPTDGEAWLILGGAYQERGSDRAARHAYASCAQNAKPGHARSECASLARSP
jgi:tetratricopeptide (TPR) repeat protein